MLQANNSENVLNMYYPPDFLLSVSYTKMNNTSPLTREEASKQILWILSDQFYIGGVERSGRWQTKGSREDFIEKQNDLSSD